MRHLHSQLRTTSLRWGAALSSLFLFSLAQPSLAHAAGEEASGEAAGSKSEVANAELANAELAHPEQANTEAQANTTAQGNDPAQANPPEQANEATETSVRPAPAPAGETARPAKTGFQAAFRTGVMFPGGRATGKAGDTLAARYSWAVPFMFDVGFKPTEHLFFGTYFGLAWGAEGSYVPIEGACLDDDDDLVNDVSCNSITLRWGLEAQYHFSPDQRWNPWVGYGFGLEATDQSIDERGKRRESTISRGVTFAQLSGGVDFRSAVGLGPFFEASVGRFNSSRTEVNDVETFDGDIRDRALHYWLTLGLRLVVRP